MSSWKWRLTVRSLRGWDRGKLNLYHLKGDDKIYSLYKITNLLNNKNYIGVTNRNPEERFAEHKRPSSKSFISKAIQSDGVDNFSFEILLTEIEDKDISDLEYEYIKKYNSLLPNGYNADLGGVEYHKHSDYVKQIISEKGKGNKNSKYVADVLMYDKQGNLLNRFQTAREVARYLGNESKNVGINYCLNNKQKTAYGYIWKYDKD